MTKEKKGLSAAELREALAKAERFLVTQKAMLFDQSTKKFLLILNGNNEKWELPGGLVDKGEQLIPALEREISEEIGDIEYDETIVSSASRMEYDLEGGPYPVTILGYIVNYKRGEISLSKEHIRYSWMTAEEIAALSEDEMKPVIKELLENAISRLREMEYLDDLNRR